jgi:hypothetical protein
MIIFKGYYLPGFSEGERNPEKEKSLSSYDKNNGGFVLSDELSLFLSSAINFSVDGSNRTDDPRNLIVGSGMKHNCMSEIWWMISREGEHPWTIYAGAWNEKVGVMVLEDQNLSVPAVWISSDVENMKTLLSTLL